MTAAFGNSYGHDANGNQTTRTIADVTYTLTYDYENHLTAVSGGSVSASFVYDANGNRVKGTVNGTTTVYIAGLYEYQGGATTLYYEGNALRRTGYAANNGVFYLLQDQLKSSSVLANQNGTINSRNYFYPFGGNRGGAAFSALTTKRFTGQYHEQGLPGGEGLSYYGARWYDAQLGRFTGPDTIVPGAGNPQALNRYSYVFNNPLRLIDPSGHDPIGCDSCEDRRDRAHGDLGGTSTSPFYPTPSRGCVSIMCLPTSVPQPTFLPWWASMTPTATPVPAYRALPSFTATPTSIPRQTPAPSRVNWGSAYWSVAAPVAEDATNKLGLPTVIRASGRILGSSFGRVIGSVPLPMTMAIGYGITVGPNLYKNIRNDTGLAETSTDLVTDTAGYWASFVAGKVGAGIVGFFGTSGGPGGMVSGAIVGDVIGSTGASVAWDQYIAPQARPYIREKVGWLLGE